MNEMKRKLLKIFIFLVAIMLAVVNSFLLLDHDALTNAHQHVVSVTGKLRQDIFDFRLWLEGHAPFRLSDDETARIDARTHADEQPPDDSILAENTGQVSKPGIVGNQWLSAQAHQASQFSLDIDDSNYDMLNDAVEEGIVPPRSIIRIESLINYFDFYYKQNNDKRFLINYEIAPSPLEPDTYILMLKIKTRPFDPAHDQKDWNVFFAIDNSAEMLRHPLKPEMMQTLRDIVFGMSPKDRVGFLLYNAEGETISGSTVGDYRSRLLRILEGMNFKGSFGGTEGVVIRARNIVAKHSNEKSLNKVIVITSGNFKLSDSELEQLKEKRSENVFIYIVSLKDNKALRDFYNALGDGYHIKYAELDTFDNFFSLVNESFFSESADISAKEVMSRINFYPENVNYYRLVGFSNFDAGMLENLAGYLMPVDLKYNTSRTILYKLRLNSKALRDNQPIGNLELSYREPDSMENIVINRPLYFRSNAKASSDFNFAAAVAYTGEYLSNLSVSLGYDLPAIRQLADENKGRDASKKREQFIKLLEKIGEL